MVDISSCDKKINITVSTSGNKVSVNATPDTAMYYSNKSREWAISDKIVDNEDYSSKYYANESKKQADISTAKATEVITSGNTAVSNIESARDNAIIDITNQENLSVDNVNTAGVTQVSSVNTAGATQVTNVNSAGTTQINLAKEQVTLATNQANIATEQATIATNKASEVVASGNEALSNIDTAKNNAITSITNQETTSKTSLIDEGATQVRLIQNEGATQVANVQSTGFYMRDDKLYFINSQGEETEFESDDIARIEEQLANKVDTSNTQWAANACMPDYTAGVSKSINVDYIETTNGFLVIDYTNSNAQSWLDIIINGTRFAFYQGYSGTDYSHCNVGFIPIPKNTTYKFNGTGIRVRYFPCIGG